MKKDNKEVIHRGKPQIRPEDVLQPNGTEKIVISVALDMVRRLVKPVKVLSETRGLAHIEDYQEADQELEQFKLKWDRWPVPEKYVDKAMEDMKMAIKMKMRKLGLMC